MLRFRAQVQVGDIQGSFDKRNSDLMLIRGTLLGRVPDCLLVLRRKLKTYVSELRKGDWIEHDGRILIVHQVNSSHSGRGARQFLIMLKEAIGDSFTTIKPSSRDFFESIASGDFFNLELEMQDISHQFLYEADEMVHLLNPRTLEEIVIPGKMVVGNLLKLLEGGTEIKVRMSRDKPVIVHSNVRHFKCTVAKVLEKLISNHRSMIQRNNHIGPDKKIMVVETVGGAKISCSANLAVGDQILVNISDLSYQVWRRGMVDKTGTQAVFVVLIFSIITFFSIPKDKNMDVETIIADNVADKGISTVVLTSRPTPGKNPRSIARVHDNVNSKLPASYWDYEALNIKWGSQDIYEIVEKVGRGKYSEVFSGINVPRNERCIIKVLKPVKSKKIKREVKILQNLAGGPNIIQLKDLVIEPESRTPAFIFELVNNVDHRTLYPKLSDYDVRFYIFQLLRALEFSHSRGIMHRDVKPHNVMIDPQTRTIRLIDWGLAEFYHPGVPYNVRVASRYYKGPELLVDLLEYDYSLDMWSLGCMFGGMIFMIDTLFHGRDSDDQLVRIIEVLGSDEFKKYIEKYDLKIPKHVQGLIAPRVPWKSYINKQNEHLAGFEAVDLLDHLLRYDHHERFSAVEAMAHPYFDPIRDSILNNVVRSKSDL